MNEISVKAFVAKHAHRLALSFASLLILYWFLPELKYASIFYNDAVSHIAVVRWMDAAWERGGNITDFWMGYINFGHPLLRSYQFLLHLVIWLVHKIILPGVSVERTFVYCCVVAAMAFPWCMYKGCRILGLNRLEAVIAGIATIFIHERDGYGLGLTNFTYSGYGTYNQLFAMLFFPSAIGYTHRLITTGRNVVLASLLFSATFMAHILTGYFACVWIGIEVLLALVFERKSVHWKKLAVSLATFAGLTLLWTGHWVIPMAQDTLLQHKSEFEAAWKWTGHGAEKMLADFASGEILDADRLPILTILSALGLLFCGYSWITWLRARHRSARDSKTTRMQRLLFIQGVAWLLLTFGPQTWGPILNILPFSGSLHWHRFFAGAQFTFMLCIGVLMAAAYRATTKLPEQLKLAVVTGLCTLLLAPCLSERKKFFYATNAFWLKDTQQLWQSPERGYKAALEFALKHDEGRYEVGNPYQTSWGSSLKVSSTIPFYALLVQHNIEDVGAIHHHQNHSEVLAFKGNVRNPLHAELMNVRYVGLTKADTPPRGYISVLQTHDAVLYDNGNRTGYFAVGRALPDSDACADNDSLSRAVVAYLQSPLLEAHVYPRMKLQKNCEGLQTIEDELARAARTLGTPGGLPGKILESAKQPGPSGDIHTAKVHMSAPGILLFKMNYHPSWRAQVDGKPAETLMVLPAFTAIRLETGTHEIKFSYEVSPLKKILLWLTMSALLALVGSKLIFLRRKK